MKTQPVACRLDDVDLKIVDELRGDAPRSTFLKTALAYFVLAMTGKAA